MISSDLPNFLDTALAAFPPSCQAAARPAANALMPFVDGAYRHRSLQAAVLGDTIQVPYRIHFVGLDLCNLRVDDRLLPVIHCLCTRSTDGHVRQSALRHLLCLDAAWVIPYIAILASEYVVEITKDMAAALPTLNKGAYVNFVRENPSLIELLRQRAYSYWNCYHRASWPNRDEYPGLVFIHQVERWAALERM